MKDAWGNELPDDEADELTSDELDRLEYERIEHTREIDHVEAVKAALSTRQSRQFIWDVMAMGEVFGGAFDPDPYKAAFKEGKRQIAAAIFRMIDPVTFYTMQVEHQEREARYHVTPTEPKETTDV